MTDIELIADINRQVATLATEIQNRAAKIEELQSEICKAALRIGNEDGKQNRGGAQE